MDANYSKESDDYLLIDLYLEGWLNEEAGAALLHRVETETLFAQKAAVLVALREQAAEYRQDENSEQAVRVLLSTLARQRKPVSRIRHIRRIVYQAINELPRIAVVVGLIFLAMIAYMWVVYSGSDRPITKHQRLPGDTLIKRGPDPDELVVKSDTVKKFLPKKRPVLLANTVLPVFVREESDGTFGLGTAEIAVDTLPTRLFRVSGRAEYELRTNVLNLYLPQVYWQKKPVLHLNRESDSTLTLRINTIPFRLIQKGRHPLK